MVQDKKIMLLTFIYEDWQWFWQLRVIEVSSENRSWPLELHTKSYWLHRINLYSESSLEKTGENYLFDCSSTLIYFYWICSQIRRVGGFLKLSGREDSEFVLGFEFWFRFDEKKSVFRECLPTMLMWKKISCVPIH